MTGSTRWFTRAAMIVAAAGGLSAAGGWSACPEDPDDCTGACCGESCDDEVCEEVEELVFSELANPIAVNVRQASIDPDDVVVRRMVMTQKAGDRTITVKINNDDVVALINGKQIDGSRVKQSNGHVIVLGDGGDEIANFAVVIPDASGPRVRAQTMQLKSAPNDGYELRVVPEIRGLAVAPRVTGHVGDGNVVFETAPGGMVKFGDDDDVAFSPPPVMVGISMGEPGEGLREHFGFGEGDAILVIGVADGLPAAKAGIKVHDIITEINGEGPANSARLLEALKDMSPGDSLDLTVIRKGREREVSLATVAYSADRLARLPRPASPDAEGVPAAPAAPNVQRYWSPEGGGRGFSFTIPDINITSPELSDEARVEMEKQIAKLAEEFAAQGNWEEMANKSKEYVEKYARELAAEANQQAHRFRLNPEPGFTEAPNVFVAPQRRAPAGDDRMERLENRLERLEASLDRLIERLERDQADREVRDERTRRGSGR